MAETLSHPLGVCSKLKHGSRFHVSAPYAGTAVAGPSLGPAAIRAEPYGFAGTEVLVIDNDPAVQEAMHTLLERWSCRMRFVRSLEEVGTLISEPRYRPVIVLADYHLDHGETGLAAIQRLRAVMGAGMPAIVITADHSAEIADLVRGSDCEILRKPVRPAELRALMQHLIG